MLVASPIFLDQIKQGLVIHMAVGDIWQVNNEFEYQDNANIYSWYLRVETEGDAAAVPADMLAFGVDRQVELVLLHNPFVNFRCTTARQIYPDNGLPQMEITGEVGSRLCTPVGDVLPGQCCCVITLYGDIANPDANNRGRDFFTGMCCSDQVNGTLDHGAPATYLQDVCDMYQRMTHTWTVGGNSYTIGVYSPSKAKPAGWPGNPSIPPFFWPLEHVRARSLIRTQRRRQPLDPCEPVCNATVPATTPPL